MKIAKQYIICKNEDGSLFNVGGIVVAIAKYETSMEYTTGKTMLGKMDIIQVNLYQKLLFLHQLTHNMTTDCSLNYQLSTVQSRFSDTFGLPEKCH